MIREDEVLLQPLNVIDNRMRFLCTYDSGTYRLHMGQNMYREFTSDTLPDPLKEQIAMINAFDWESLNKIDPPDRNLILITMHKHYPRVCEDIGWRLDNWYALVVPYEYFLQLKGVLTTSGDKP